MSTGSAIPHEQGALAVAPITDADAGALAQIRLDVGDEVTDRLVTDFLDRVEGRVARLGALLRAGPADDAITVLLSLETTGRMVGASELAAACAQARAALGQNQQDDIELHYHRIMRAAGQFRTAFET